MNLRNAFLALLSLLCAIVLGVFSGMLWFNLRLYAQHPLPWLTLPLGWLLAWVMCKIRPPDLIAVLLAALAVFTAAFYARLWLIAAQLAGQVGTSLFDAMHTAGPGMMLQLTRLGTSSADIAWAAAGAAVAMVTIIFTAWHERSRQVNNSARPL